MMNKEDLQKFIDDLIDSLPADKVYLNSAKVLLRKLKNDEDFHIKDFEAMRIILEDYIERMEY